MERSQLTWFGHLMSTPHGCVGFSDTSSYSEAPWLTQIIHLVWPWGPSRVLHEQRNAVKRVSGNKMEQVNDM